MLLTMLLLATSVAPGAAAIGVPLDNTLYDCATLPPIPTSLFTLALDNLTTSITLTNITFANCQLPLTVTGAYNIASFSLTLVDVKFVASAPPAAEAGAPLDAPRPAMALLLKDVDAGAVVTLQRCTFEGSTGGASNVTAPVVAVADSAGPLQLVVQDCSWRGNEGSDSLRISNSNVELQLSGTNFTNNGGSAVALINAKTPPGRGIAISGCTFEGGRSVYGPGLMLRSTSLSGQMHVTDTTLRNNTAYMAGGAIYIISSSLGQGLCLTRMTCTDNTAAGLGGCMFGANMPATLQDCTLSRNTAQQGGAIFVRGEYQLTADACVFEDNMADAGTGGEAVGGALALSIMAYALVTNATFARNRAGFGGAIGCSSCNYANVTQSLLSANTAGSGGALGLSNAFVASSLTNVTFSANTATVLQQRINSLDCSPRSVGMGGAVCVSLSAPLILDSCEFNDNAATSGGALFVGVSYLSDAAAAQLGAGGGGMTHMPLRGTGLKFNRNKAQGGAGGALFVAELSYVVLDCGTACLTHPDWQANEATDGGYGPQMATAFASLMPQPPAVLGYISGTMLPLQARLYDELGQAITKGCADSDTLVVTVSLPVETLAKTGPLRRMLLETDPLPALPEADPLPTVGEIGPAPTVTKGSLAGTTYRTASSGLVDLANMMLNGEPDMYTLILTATPAGTGRPTYITNVTVQLTAATVSPFSVVPQDHTVYDCSVASVPFFKLVFIDVKARLTLTNITFINCYCPLEVYGTAWVDDSNGFQLDLVDLTFINCFSPGGVLGNPASALFLHDTGPATITLTRVSFVGCRYQSTVTLMSPSGTVALEFDSCSWEGGENAGGVLVMSTTVALSLTDSHFTNVNGTAVTVSNCKTPPGTGVTLEGCSVTGGQAELAAGLVMLMTAVGGNVALRNVTFVNNTGYGMGTAVMVGQGAISGMLNWEGGECTDNVAAVAAGCLFASNVPVRLMGVRLLRNVGQQGGAIFVRGDYDLTLVDSELSHNAALGSESGGGAVVLSTLAAAWFRGTTLHNNSAGFGGAVECTRCGGVHMDNCELTSNKASAGGAIAIRSMSGGGATSVLTNCTFRDNAVPGGQTVTAQDCKRGVVGLGGAVCISILEGLTISGCTFTNNSATTGGALFASKNYAEDDPVGGMSMLTVVDIDVSRFSANYALGGAGGAVYATELSMLDLSGCLLEDTSCIADDNAATDGGYGPRVATGFAALQQPADVAGYISGRALDLQLQLLDALGQAITRGCADANGLLVTAKLPASAAGDGTGTISKVSGKTFEASVGGVADLSGLTLVADPGLYNVTLTAAPNSRPPVETQFTVEVKAATVADGSVVPQDNTTYDCDPLTPEPFYLNFYDAGGSLTLRNITFANCATPLIVFGMYDFRLTLEDVIFVNSTAGEGAGAACMLVFGVTDGTATVTLTRVRFVSSMQGPSVAITDSMQGRVDLVMQDCVFEGGKESHGISIFRSAVDVAIHGTQFRNLNGSAVYMDSSSTPPLTGVQLFGCSVSGAVTSAGAGVMLVDSSIGGALFIVNTHMQGNFVFGEGGAVAVVRTTLGAGMAWVDGSCSGNWAVLAGGCIYAFNVAVSLSGVQLSGNTAPQGGAVYVRGSYQLLVEDCTLSDNVALGPRSSGGAVTMSALSFGAFKFTTFQNNSAVYGGAVECQRCAWLTTDSSQFLHNSASSGGALAMRSASDPSSRLYNTAFEGNSVPGGHEVTSMDCTRGVVGLGGAICISLLEAVEMDSCTFAGNSATTGGAVFVGKSYDDDVLAAVGGQQGSAVALRTGSFTANTANGGAGGAIYATELSMLDLSGCPLEDTACIADDNAATDGGYGPRVATGFAALQQPADVAGYISGRALDLQLQLLDGLGQAITRGCADANGLLVTAKLPGDATGAADGPASALSGTTYTSSKQGVADLSGLALVAPPGLYTVTLTAEPDSRAPDEAALGVEVKAATVAAGTVVPQDNTLYDCLAAPITVPFELIFNDPAGALTLTNITFANCATPLVAKGEGGFSLTLVDVTFDSCTSSGGVMPAGLLVTGIGQDGSAAVTLTRVVSRNSTLGPTVKLLECLGPTQLRLESCTFEGGTSSHAVEVRASIVELDVGDSQFRNLNGSALYMSLCTTPAGRGLTMTNCSVSGAAAGAGAGLMLDDSNIGGGLTILDTYMEGNYVYDVGGGIAVVGTSVATMIVWSRGACRGNAALTAGGCIYALNVPLLLQGMLLSGNTAPQGGAIYVRGAYTLYASNVTLADNVALAPRASGGAVTLSALSSAEFFQCTFTNNSAVYGGAVECQRCGSLQAMSSNFIRNRADSGGALAIRSPTELSTLTGVLFEGNSVPGGQNITSMDCTRGVVGLGGAICISLLEGLTVSYSTFIGNSATTGGATFVGKNYDDDAASITGLFGGQGPAVTVYLSNYTDNVAAGGAGGALFVTEISMLRDADECANVEGPCSLANGNAATEGGYGADLATGFAALAQPDAVRGYISGRPIVMHAQLLDALNQTITKGCADANGLLVTASLLPGGSSSSTPLLSGTTYGSSSSGRVDLAGLSLQADPGAYTLALTATPVSRPASSARVSVEVKAASVAPGTTLPQDNTVYDCAAMSPGPSGPLFELKFDENAGSVVLRNVTFRNCPYGALAVIGPYGFRLTLADCAFINNTIVGPLPATLPAHELVGGAALRLALPGPGAVVTLQRCTFSENVQAVGSAIYLVGATSSFTLSATNCLFDGNSGSAALHVNSSTVALTLSGCTFRGQRGGRALLLEGSSTPSGQDLRLQGCVFEGNAAGSGSLGGALLLTNVSLGGGILLADTHMQNNTAGTGGALAIEGCTSQQGLTLSNVTCTGNAAGELGGCAYVSNMQALVKDCLLAGNSAQQGGALLVRGEYTTTIRGSAFDRNAARPGALSGGGAVTASALARLSLQAGTRFTKNSADFAGAVECAACASVHASGVLFSSNRAGAAGAVALDQPQSACAFDGCTFTSNEAAVRTLITDKDCTKGAVGLGGALCVSLLGSVALSGATAFEGNSATTGGAIFIAAAAQNTAGRASLDPTVVLRNNAAVGGAGGGLYVSTLSLLQLPANCSLGQLVAQQQQPATAAPGSPAAPIAPPTPGDTTASSCPTSWVNNTASGGGWGPLAATSFRWLSGPSWVGDYVSGELLPGVALQLLDELGQPMSRGATDTSGLRVTASLDALTTPNATATTSQQKQLRAALSGTLLNSSIDGSLEFNLLRFRAQPGNYTIEFAATGASYTSTGASTGASSTSNSTGNSAGNSTSSYSSVFTLLVVGVRAGCAVGQVVDSSNDVCAPCSDNPPTFTFNPANGSCDACPPDALCRVANISGAQLVPRDGFWHSSPLSPQIYKCRIDGACIFSNRTERLALWQANMTGGGQRVWKLPSNASSVEGVLGRRRNLLQNASSSSGNASEAALYWSMQCSPGYDGVLCAQCAQGYGSSSTGCNKCPEAGLNTLYYVLSYSITVLLLVITIRAQVVEARKGAEVPWEGGGGRRSSEVGDAGAKAPARRAGGRRSLERRSDAGEDDGLPVVAGKGAVQSDGDAHNSEAADEDDEQEQSPRGGAAGKKQRQSAAEGDEDGNAQQAQDGRAREPEDDEPVSSIIVMKIVIKILVNYLQVTTVLRQIDLVYPAAVVKLFDIGNQISSAVGRLVSLDCSLSDVTSKALQRTAINILLPLACCMLAVPLWLMVYGIQRWRAGRAAARAATEAGFSLARQPPPPGADQQDPDKAAQEAALKLEPKQPLPSDEGQSQQAVAAVAAADDNDDDASPGTLASYLPHRLIISIIAIIFFFYPSVTTELLQLLACEQLDTRDQPYGAYAEAVGYFWTSDYGVQCYEGLHLVMVCVLAIPGLVLFSVGVPIASGLWLWRAARRLLLDDPSFASRYSFLYSDYKRSHYYWESAIMARKLLVVAVLVALSSQPLVVQIHCLMGIVMMAGLAQTLMQPYARPIFNQLESLSLAATVLSLWLCYFFLLSDQQLDEGGKIALSVCLFSINIAVLLYFGYCLAVEVWRYALWRLDVNKDGKVERSEVQAFLRTKIGGPLAFLVAWVADKHQAMRDRKRGSKGADQQQAAAAGQAPDPKARGAPNPPLSPSGSTAVVPLGVGERDSSDGRNPTAADEDRARSGNSSGNEGATGTGSGGRRVKSRPALDDDSEEAAGFASSTPQQSRTAIVRPQGSATSLSAEAQQRAGGPWGDDPLRSISGLGGRANSMHANVLAAGMHAERSQPSSRRGSRHGSFSVNKVAPAPPAWQPGTSSAAGQEAMSSQRRLSDAAVVLAAEQARADAGNPRVGSHEGSRLRQSTGGSYGSGSIRHGEPAAETSGGSVARQPAGSASGSRRSPLTPATSMQS